MHCTVWYVCINFVNCVNTSLFITRDAMHSADYAVARYLSVCSSVCSSHASILSKRLNLSNAFTSNSHTVLVFQRQWNGNTSKDGDQGAPNAGVRKDRAIVTMAD